MPLATETIPEIIALIAELVDAGHAYEAGGDVYFRVASFATYGALSGHRPDQIEDQEPSPLKEDPARLRALEGDEGRRGHLVGLAVGPGAAGLAHRVLGDGREDARARVPDPRRRARPRLPPPRERARAVAGRRAPVREDLDAQRAAAVHRREDVEVGRQRGHDPGGDRRVGAGGGAALPDDRPLAQAARVLAGDDDGGERPGREPAQRAARRDASGGRLGRARRRARRRLQHARRARRLPPAGRARARSTSCGAGSPIFGLGGLGDAVEAPAEVVALAQARAEARTARDFAESDRLRDEIAAAGWEVRDVRDAPGGFELVPLP